MQRRFHEFLGACRSGKLRGVRRLQLESLERRLTLSASGGIESTSALTMASDTGAEYADTSMRADIPDQVFAPYMDATLWPPFDPVAYANDQGVKHVTLAFVVADPLTSEPSWGGYYSVASDYRGDQIDAIQELGGEVMVSFGGAAGTPLAAAITDVDELTHSYQAVIDQYDLTWMDFDVEGSWVADQVSIDRRSQAIRNLQDQARVDGRPLEVWFTLPVLPSGLTSDGQYVVESALNHGVDIGGVNIMAMNYGDGAAPNPEGQMGAYAIEASMSLFDQMQQAYDEAGIAVTEEEMWSLIGVTPMLGQNDVMSERFYVEDAEELLAFADEVGMGLLSAWSVNRDAPCDTLGILALDCSGVPQEPFEFSQTLSQFTTGVDDAGNDPLPDNPTEETDPVDPTEETDPAEETNPDSLQGEVYLVNAAGPDIVDFDVSQDRLDFGEISVHNLIMGKLPTGEIAMVNPWAWTPEYQVIQDRTYTDLGIENYGVVANEHLRQDLGGVVSWEQGVGPREADTVYVRSHEYDVQERIDDFDPSTMKLSFLYFGTRERLSVEDTPDGLLISTQPTNQSVLLTGISKADLIPANIEFHHDQIVEDQLEVPFGFTVDQLTLVSRADLLTPAAPAGEITDGHQTRPGSENHHHHDGHDHDHGMMPSVSIDDVVVTEGSPDDAVSRVLSTEGNQIVDSAGEPVRLAGVSWFGMETTSFAPHGLWARSYVDMMDQMQAEGFNTIRLPYSDELFATESTPNGINFTQNPDLEGLSGLEIMDRIIARADEIGMRVILDHHRSAAGNSANESGLWYSAEYPESVWIENLTQLATRYAENPSVVGIDLHNEPHGPARWGDGSVNDWRLAAERAGNAVLAANPNLLIIVEGVEIASSGGYWWGGNLSNAGEYPVRLDVANRLVYSAHDYPASVYQQPYFNDPSYPNNLTEVWDQNWGYLFREGIAPVLLGEFGSKLETASDQQWFDSMVDYLQGDLDGDGENDLAANQQGMSWTYWSWNPNSGDTGGILAEDWVSVHDYKVDALEPIQFDFADVDALVTVRLSMPAMQTVTVDYVTADATALAASDYSAAAGTLEFLPGEMVKTFRVNIAPDAVVEGDEQFVVNLSNVTNAMMGDGSAIVTIVDDDADSPGVPTLSIANASVTEADTEDTELTFEVLLSEVATEDVFVDFETVAGSAVAPDDFAAVSGTLTIPAGENGGEIKVLVAGDLLEEADESMQMSLSNAVNATLGGNTATGTILDNDRTVVAPGFAYRTTDDWGSGFNGEITLTNRGEEAWSAWEVEFEWEHQLTDIWDAVLIRQVDGKIVVQNEFWNGTVAPGKSVTFGFGGSPGNVTTKPRQVFVNGIAAEVGQATPTLSVADVKVAEGDSGSTFANFALSLSAASQENITVNYKTEADSASAGSDFQAQTGTITIPAGSRNAVIPVSVYGDTEEEANESFRVVLWAPTGAVLANTVATATIQDDDSVAVNSSAKYLTVNDWGSGFTGELKLTNQTNQAWDGWEVKFEWEHNLTQFWNGTLVSHEGDTYVVKNASWNGRVEPGASVTFGFSGNPGNVTTEPKNVVILGPAAVAVDDAGDAEETPLEVNISKASAVEPDEGTKTLSFQVKLSRAVAEGQTASVDYSTVAGTATANEDFIPVNGTLHFMPGELEKTVDVLLKGDTVAEADETFEVVLSQIVNAQLGVKTAVGTIQDNDVDLSDSVQWSVSSSWATGYVASIVITNKEPEPWTDWELEFDSPHTITSIWGAEIVSREGTRYRIRPLSWNQTLAPGGKISIGYRVDTGGPLEPTNFLLKRTQ